MLQGRALTYYKENLFQKALNDFKQALTLLDPNNKELLQDLHRGIGWCCYRLHDTEKAILNFNQALHYLDFRMTVQIADVKKGLELCIGKKVPKTLLGKIKFKLKNRVHELLNDSS